ncbi:hypothetical protein Gpo141_00013636, partial [Globisporangium polare]
LAVAAIGAPDLASAADINVLGARDSPIMRSADNTATTDRGVDVKMAAADDILSKPTGLVNKNTLATDNNVFVSRSNIVFSQNDRLKLAKKVEAMVTAADAKDMSTAVLSKSILNAVSGKDTDTAMLSKASAVVAARDEPTVRGQRVADLVNAVFDDKAAATEAQETAEQTIQSETPRGVIVLVGTKDILRQPTGIVNKNAAVSDNQIVISRSNLAPSQNDAVTLGDNAKVADYVAPASAIRVATTTNSNEMDAYRVGFLYNKEEEAGANDTDDLEKKKKKATKKGEQFGLGWGGGLRFGWRYPLGYWNLYGAGLYGGGCGLGLGFGGFFYC